MPALRLALAAATLASLGAGLELDYNSISSIEEVTSNIAWNMMHFYYGNETGNVPGTLPSPYFWWEMGGLCGHMVDYYYYTGDDSYNQEIIQAIVYQAGNNGFMPQNQTLDEGNDDQVFWAFAAMDAAEFNFPPPSTGPALWVENSPSWVAMAQAVFNLQQARWDPVCGGGLRWQFSSFNNGYYYKNMASNGGFFQLAARLARYTANNTYLEWAEKEWDWLMTQPVIDQTTWQVNDGINITEENTCGYVNTQQFSYNYGILIAGLAYAYNYTSDPKWLTPLEGIIDQTINTFFPDGTKVMIEVICEYTGSCTADLLTFRGFTLRWLALTTQLVPQLASKIWPYIQQSAIGAAGQCSGTVDGETDVCGYLWNTTTWDGTYGPGQQMSSLAVVGANMIPLKNLPGPLSLKTGANSSSDPTAGIGTGSNNGLSSAYTEPITTASRAGAGVLTALLLGASLGGTYWLIV